jgi:hypothetical protein
MKHCQENQTLVKMGKNVGQFTWTSKYVYIVDSSEKYFVAFQ